ncbi:hypothetical protein [Streptomyces winkii]|uniref:hypothetical protein n=1 Tax=Streptomyces winkii TaxID=3051178 RepID=UPI0028D52D9A|nr:hypothetical protein [Streptomyces sp. DSM 40971]
MLLGTSAAPALADRHQTGSERVLSERALAERAFSQLTVPDRHQTFSGPALSERLVSQLTVPDRHQTSTPHMPGTAPA